MWQTQENRKILKNAKNIWIFGAIPGTYNIEILVLEGPRMSQKTMLATALTILHAETGSKFRSQVVWWDDVFRSYCCSPECNNISTTYVSKYVCGERIITSKYTRHYSTAASLHLPPRLVNDLKEHLDRYASQPELRIIYAGMIDYCKQQHTYDRAKLMPDALVDNPGLTTTATLCAAVIWHAMCYDLSHAAKAEKEGYDE